MKRRAISLLGLLAIGVACTAAPNPPAGAAWAGSSIPTASRDPDSPYLTTQEAFLLATAACVEDKGYPVEVDLRQAGFKFNLGDDARVPAAREALNACMRDIDPRRLEPPPKLTREQLVAWYQYKLRIVECLTAAGQVVPEPPPEAVFVDSEGEWDPFGSIVDSGQPLSPDLQAKCEQVDGAPAFLNW